MKIGIVGAGMVGSAAAYAMTMRGVGSEIVLVDRNSGLAAAQAQDIQHATPFAYASRISAGNYDDLADARVVVVSAGVGQRPGESRMALLGRNAEVFAEIIPAVLRASPQTILVIASNPVDIMTYVATQLSGLPPRRVIGTGTVLDTARFRSLLAEFVGVSAKSIHAHVIGEHGDSEVLCWSTARSGGLVLEDVAAQVGHPLDASIRSRIDSDVRNAAYRIIEGKGATWYGIGAGVSRIVQAIETDENAVLTLSGVEREVQGVPNVALSLPRVVGAGGAVVSLAPDLDSEEKQALRRSAKLLRSAIDEMEV